MSKRMQMGSSGSFGGSGNSGAFSDSSDVFSIDLYRGNGGSPNYMSGSVTITNNINLASQGGLVIFRGRNPGGHAEFFDTERGGTKILECGGTRSTEDEDTVANAAGITFNSNGYVIGNDQGNFNYNQNNGSYVAYTYRKAPKFFDIVTYTGNGTNQAIAHNLDCEVGMIWVKRRNADGYAWVVYHRGANSGSGHLGYLRLNANSAFQTSSSQWNDTAPTTTHFTVGSAQDTNGSGGTYVAYLFAHDTDADSIIKCGDFTVSNNAQTAGQFFDTEFGFEPNYVTLKATSRAQEWKQYDTVRGLGYNLNEEFNWNGGGNAGHQTTNSYAGFMPMSKGFLIKPSNANYPIYNSASYVYTVIKRPMPKVSDVSGTLSGTSGSTNVFYPSSAVNVTGAAVYTTPSWTNNGLGTNLAPVVDMSWSTNNGSVIYQHSRLLGRTGIPIGSNADTSELALSYIYYANRDDPITHGFGRNQGTSTYHSMNWRRATGFFDMVYYRGTHIPQTIDHNLGAVPKMMIIKRVTYATSSTTSTGNNYFHVYHADAGNTKTFKLGQNANYNNSNTYFNSTSPTATQFTVGYEAAHNAPDALFQALLFGEVSGVSKIGSYTGGGTNSVTVDCGFTNGIDFLFFKNIGTNSQANYNILFNRQFGITTSAGNDTSLQIKQSPGGFITNEDSIQQHSSGFTLMPNTSSTNANISGDTYLFYAIANST
tara:strand:+ start:1279 stop:3402 length:2124 start_codon:yes stop_codon:yes gene_type:complete